MPEVKVRKMLVSVEEIFHEGGPVADTPLRKASCLAIIENPYAGRYEAEIAGFMDDLKPLGIEMAGKLIEALGGDAKTIEGYAKGPSSVKPVKLSTVPCGMCRAVIQCVN